MALTLKDLDYTQMRCTKEFIPANEATQLFFPEGDDIEGKTMKAKQICSGCPMMETCFQVALDNKEWGIWGGATKKEREYLARRPREKARFFRALRAGKQLKLIKIEDENTVL